MTRLSEILEKLNVKTAEGEPIDQKILFKRVEALMVMRVPKRFSGVAFDTYDTSIWNDEEQFNEIVALADALKWCVLRSIKTGRMKTGLAISMMGRSQYKSGYKSSDCLFVDLRDDGAKLRVWENQEAILDKWKSKKILLLDEIGREPESMKENVQRIIGTFHNELKQVIMTTAMTPKQWDKWVGVEITRRIEDNGSIIDLKG